MQRRDLLTSLMALVAGLVAGVVPGRLKAASSAGPVPKGMHRFRIEPGEILHCKGFPVTVIGGCELEAATSKPYLFSAPVPCSPPVGLPAPRWADTGDGQAKQNGEEKWHPYDQIRLSEWDLRNIPHLVPYYAGAAAYLDVTRSGGTLTFKTRESDRKRGRACIRTLNMRWELWWALQDARKSEANPWCVPGSSTDTTKSYTQHCFDELIAAADKSHG